MPSGADQWGQVKKLTAADGAAYDRFGYSVAINGQADAIVAGAYYANIGGVAQQGAAYVYQKEGDRSGNFKPHTAYTERWHGLLICRLSGPAERGWF